MDESAFLDLLHTYFPFIYDVKYIHDTTTPYSHYLPTHHSINPLLPTLLSLSPRTTDGRISLSRFIAHLFPLHLRCQVHDDSCRGNVWWFECTSRYHISHLNLLYIQHLTLFCQTCTLFILSTHPLNTPSPHTLSTHPLNTSSQPSFSTHRFINIPPYFSQNRYFTSESYWPYQHTLSTQTINTPSQPSQHPLSTLFLNPLFQHTFSLTPPSLS